MSWCTRRRGPSTCSTRPLLRIKRVPTCQYLQSFVIWSGREIHRSSKSHRWGAVFCTSFRGANERIAALSSFYRNGWRGPCKWAPCSIPTNGDLCEKRVQQTKLIQKGFCPATVTPSAVRSLHRRDKSICKFRSTT